MRKRIVANSGNEFFPKNFGANPKNKRRKIINYFAPPCQIGIAYPGLAPCIKLSLFDRDTQADKEMEV